VAVGRTPNLPIERPINVLLRFPKISQQGFKLLLVTLQSEDVSLLKKELERGKKDLEKVSKLRARCVMLDWYHNKQNKVLRTVCAAAAHW